MFDAVEQKISTLLTTRDVVFAQLFLIGLKIFNKLTDHIIRRV